MQAAFCIYQVVFFLFLCLSLVSEISVFTQITKMDKMRVSQTSCPSHSRVHRGWWLIPKAQPTIVGLQQYLNKNIYPE